MIKYTAIAFALSMPLNAMQIETTTWGDVWNRRGMAEYITSTNTPGSDDFCNHRLSHPSLLAFLDGFDTRKYHTESTNNFQPSVIRPITNTSPRFAFYDSFDARRSMLRELTTISDYRSGRDTGNAYNGLWSWSGLESAMNLSPVTNDFGFTQDIASKIFNGTRSGWFPVFKGLCPSVCFPGEYKSYYDIGYRWPGMAYDAIAGVTFRDPGFVTLETKESSHLLEATPFTFDQVLSNAFSHVCTSNMMSQSRRMIPDDLAVCDQTLSLFDRKFRQDGQLYAINNVAEKHYKARIKASGHYSKGYVYISMDSGGNYTAEPLDGVFVPDTPEHEEESVTTNFATLAYAPFLSVSAPVYSAGVTLTLNGSEAGNRVYGWDAEVVGKLDDMLYGLEGTNVVEFSFFVSGTDIMLDAHCGYRYLRNYIAIPFPRISPGGYEATGTASIKADYRSEKTSSPNYNIPYSTHENWPANREYLTSLKTFFFSSFAASTNGTTEISFADYIGNPTGDWINRVDFGYAARIVELASPSSYKSSLFTRLNELDVLIGPIAGSYDSPIEYTRMTDGAFEDYCAHLNSWNLVVTETNFGTPSGPASATYEVFKDGNEYVFRKLGTETEWSTFLTPKSVSASLSCNPASLSDYDFRRNPFRFDSKIRSVSEAIWRFPQLHEKE